MSHADLSDLEVVLHLCRQFQQTKVVCDGGPFLADPLGHLLLGQVALVNQPLVAHRHFNRVEVLSLDVFHNRHLQHTLVVCVADVGRNHLHSREPAGPEAPLTADNLVSVRGFLSHRNRLDESESPNGFGQFCKCILIEGHSWLERVWLDHVNRNHKYVRRTTWLFSRFGAYDYLVDISDRLADVFQIRCLSEQCPEALSQSSLSFRRHISIFYKIL